MIPRYQLRTLYSVTRSSGLYIGHGWDLKEIPCLQFGVSQRKESVNDNHFRSTWH
jgi:hypothetical protein